MVKFQNGNQSNARLAAFRAVRLTSPRTSLDYLREAEPRA